MQIKMKNVTGGTRDGLPGRVDLVVLQPYETCGYIYPLTHA
jgi:hypothetical protein